MANFEQAVVLDPARIEDLGMFTPSELVPILELVVSSTSDVLDWVAGAIERDELPGIAELAHRAANETLAVGANELKQVFLELEVASRADSRAQVVELARRANEMWPATRRAIEALIPG